MRNNISASRALDKDQPVAIAAFTGLFDAGFATSELLQHLMTMWDCELIYSIQDEYYYDYTHSRPVVTTDVDTQILIWPRTEIYRGQTAEGRIVHFILGAEPDLAWQEFSHKIMKSLQLFDIEALITLGAAHVSQPHSRPTSVEISSNNSQTQQSLGIRRSDYEGPASIAHVLHEAAKENSLWDIALLAGVPNYVQSHPWPGASVALLQALEQLLDISIPRGELDDDSKQWFTMIEEMVQIDEELAAHIHQLETEYDEKDMDVVSGDTIALDFERYLKRHGDDRGQ